MFTQIADNKLKEIGDLNRDGKSMLGIKTKGKGVYLMNDGNNKMGVHIMREGNKDICDNNGIKTFKYDMGNKEFKTLKFGFSFRYLY